MFKSSDFKAAGLDSPYEKIMNGERLDFEDGMRLWKSPDITLVGALANHVRLQKHGLKTFYVVNRQINYTNVCANDCIFCAFRRDKESDPDAFVLDHDLILKKIADAHVNNADLDEMHMVGGCHPDLGLDWFEELLLKIGERFPDLPLKAFTPVEISHFSRKAGISTKETLARLKKAGLRMMPGGGAEIFSENLRSKLCPQKADAQEWLRISGEAHELGLTTNCTMLFGHLENMEERTDHLCRLREQQGKSGGFACFIPLPFLKSNSKLKLSPERMGPVDGVDHLRTVAVSRLMLDNIPHIKAYWIMFGLKSAQTALWYGADDLDGTIEEEHIGHMAGARSSQALSINELEDMIRKSGFMPVRRNALFEASSAARGEG